MRLLIVDEPAAFAAYLGEIFRTWGLPFFEMIPPVAVATLDPAEAPVLICPRTRGAGPTADDLVAYAERGGTLVCFCPEGALATAAGLEDGGQKAAPLRLRVSRMPAAGLAGELLPVVGEAREHRLVAKDAQALAHLVYPQRYAGESPGIVERAAGRGKIVAFAFDLPRCVLLLRQGDPAHAEVVPTGFPPHLGAWLSVVFLACDLGPPDAGWAPFADLLARLLVDVARHHFPAPLPMLWHLPGDASSVLLYSGDEDGAQVAWNDQEFHEVTAAGGRMNLYIIADGTHSTPDDAARYQRHHDLGPHPNLRPLDARPRAERIAEYERQVRRFEDIYGVKARTVRNHCLAWVGYTDLPEAQERVGIRMDANYLAGGGFLRHRTFAPYTDFGSAMPMRFCRPDGRLIDVFQQPFHVEDDAWFSDWIEYSAKLTPERYEPVIRRCLDDAAGRFHTPLGVNFHPSNWVDFSGEQGQATLQAAAERGIPVWSFDRWCAFWEARDAWRLSDLQWNAPALTFVVRGMAHQALRILLPLRSRDAALTRLTAAGRVAEWAEVRPYGEPMALLPLCGLDNGAVVTAMYGR